MKKLGKEVDQTTTIKDFPLYLLGYINVSTLWMEFFPRFGGYRLSSLYQISIPRINDFIITLTVWLSDLKAKQN